MSDEGRYTIRITGKPALVVLLLVLGLWTWRIHVVRTTVAEGVQDSLRSALKAEYARHYFGDLDPDSVAEQAPDFTRRLDEFTKAAGAITFKSITARGTGEEIVVRAEILVDGGPPPDGKAVRYFLYSYSPVFGWCYQSETSAWYYRLKLF